MRECRGFVKQLIMMINQVNEEKNLSLLEVLIQYIIPKKHKHPFLSHDRAGSQ